MTSRNEIHSETLLQCHNIHRQSQRTGLSSKPNSRDGYQETLILNNKYVLLLLAYEYHTHQRNNSEYTNIKNCHFQEVIYWPRVSYQLHQIPIPIHKPRPAHRKLVPIFLVKCLINNSVSSSK